MELVIVQETFSTSVEYVEAQEFQKANVIVQETFSTSVVFVEEAE